MITHTITELPIAPQTSDPVNFRARGDAFLSSLNTFDDEMNDVITDINSTATTINNDATTASNAKDAAVASADFKGTWSSTTAYTVGQSVYYSGIIYRSLQAGTNKQPDTQTAYWASIATTSDKAIIMGNIIEKTSTGIGYGTGSGGTVTQVGSMYDPVLLNKPSGKIHTFSQGIPAGAFITFNLYNTQILSIDTIVSTLAGDFSTKYELNTYIQSDGFVVFSIKNKTGGTLTESRTINFTTIKGAIA